MNYFIFNNFNIWHTHTGNTLAGRQQQETQRKWQLENFCCFKFSVACVCVFCCNSIFFYFCFSHLILLFCHKLFQLLFASIPFDFIYLSFFLLFFRSVHFLHNTHIRSFVLGLVYLFSFAILWIFFILFTSLFFYNFANFHIFYLGSLIIEIMVLIFLKFMKI